MKKYICVIGIILTCFLCGCENINENPKKPTDNTSISIYIDRETGVNYYVYCGGYSGGITLRVNEDGSPYVSEVEE